MSANARTVLAVLLVGVAAVAVGLAVLAFPDADSVPEPISVALEFEPFVPGVEQSITHSVDVPVVSDVIEAGLVHATGAAERLDVAFDLCRRGACVDLRPGTVIEPGAYTVVVTAVLPATDDPVGGGAVDSIGVFAGQLLLAEVPTSASPPMSSIWLVAVLAGAAVVVGVAATLRRQVAA